MGERPGSEPSQMASVKRASISARPWLHLVNLAHRGPPEDLGARPRAKSAAARGSSDALEKRAAPCATSLEGSRSRSLRRSALSRRPRARRPRRRSGRWPLCRESGDGRRPSSRPPRRPARRPTSPRNRGCRRAPGPRNEGGFASRRNAPSASSASVRNVACELAHSKWRSLARDTLGTYLRSVSTKLASGVAGCCEK